MKISSYALAISMLVPYTIHAQSIEWLKDYGGSDALETSNTIAIDSQGSTYTVGKYYALTDFDPGTGVHELTANNTDAYILKLDANGNFLWVRTMGGDYDDEAFGVAVDEDDNVYFSGDFQGDALYNTPTGNQVLSANGAYDGFVQKLDTNGNLIWIKQFGLDNTDGAYCLTSDGQGHIYVSGRFGSTLTFEAEPNNISIVSAGDSSTDIYVLKMDTDGNIIWVKQMGGESSDEPVAITLDTQGNLYVCGRFFYQTDLDPQSSEGSFTSNGSFDCFYVKLDGSGTFLWAKQFGGLENDVVSDICTDAQGNMYATGRFKGTADFDLGAGTYELSTNNVDNAYILKLASDGEFIWAKSITSTLSSYCNEIAIGTQGEIYLVGSFGGTADFDLGASTHNLTSLGYGDFFLMKMNSDAELLWVEQVGANFYINTGSGIEIDDEETLYVTGTYGGAVDFGFGSASNPMTSYGNRDVFVLKMNSETVEVPKEILVADVSIYPNPANSFLNINSNERVQLVSIYNLMGELVQTETRNSFSIEHLPIGVCMINIETTLGTINERFIIE